MKFCIVCVLQMKKILMCYQIRKCEEEKRVFQRTFMEVYNNCSWGTFKVWLTKDPEL